MKKLLFSLLFVLTSVSAYATDGSSGCGPGWYIVDQNSLLSSALRITTNGILFPVVTIGMTVGTSNCTKHQLVLREKQSLHYATMNYHELKSEAARGDGEFIRTFAATIGCTAKAESRFTDAVKSNYQAVFPKNASDPSSALLEVYKVILNDEYLANECSLHLS